MAEHLKTSLNAAVNILFHSSIFQKKLTEHTENDYFFQNRVRPAVTPTEIPSTSTTSTTTTASSPGLSR